MNARLSSVVVLGALALTSCFPPEPPPRQRRSATGPSAAYRGDRYPEQYDAYDNPRHDDAYDAPPPAPLELPRESPPPVDSNASPANPSPAGRKEYPVAERTNKPDKVLSPYAPYNVIDVAGFKSGQLAKDPSNGKIFRVP
jgi:hypothetical protein